jgi:CRP-like cAMP-binding protein
VDVSELKNIPLFADVPDDKLLKVATFASLESAVEGKVIIREGGPANAFYAIEEGTVKVERDGDHLADLGPGDVFGETALLEKSERGATVTATSAVRMIKIDHWEIPRIRQ